MSTDNTGMQVELYEYKQKVISMLLNNEEIVKALESEVDPSEMVYENVFPYGIIDEMQLTAKVMITVEVSMPQVSTANNFFKDILLKISVICHHDLLKMTDGSIPRHDYISAKICEMLDGNKTLSSFNELTLVSNVEGPFTDRHAGRTMRFQSAELARSYC